MAMIASRARWLAAGVALAAAACHSDHHHVEFKSEPRFVEIEVEVFDPQTNGVWEGVSVRAVEGFHEWSGRTVETDNPDLWLVTDETGRVLFTADLLADAEIGFLEDDDGRAIILNDRDADEAFVLLEIDAVGFDRVWVDVPLTWRQPSVLVSVPFEPTPPGLLADDGSVAEQDGEPPRKRLAARIITPRGDGAVAVEQDGARR